MPRRDDAEELDLIRGARAGDRGSLSQLLLLHYDSLNRFVSGRISPDLQGLLKPEDVLQQTFVRVAQSIARFEPRHSGSFAAWLRTIAANLVRDAAKRRRRERRAKGWERTALRSSAGDLVELATCEGTSPSGRASQHESARRMRIAMASLPNEQRLAIEQYYFDGRSLSEIAENMGRTKDAVRGICYRARKNLRAIVGGSSLYFSG